MDISDLEYDNVFILLKPDDMGNVSFDVLTNYLSSTFLLHNLAIIGILQDFDETNTKYLNVYQFDNMMIQINSINEYVASKCKKVFHIYDLDEDGYLDKYDLQGLFAINFLLVTIEYALFMVQKYDNNKDDKLNFIDFTYFFKNQSFLINKI